MNKPSYLYVTFIATTKEKVWDAITNPEIARQYWVGAKSACSRMNVSDWKPGSKWTHERADEPGVVDITGDVIESSPPRRLVISWARPAEYGDAARHSRVTFDVEPYINGLVKLTVAHSDLEKDPAMLEGISGGWPMVLSNLKTLLETGKVLPREPEPA
ncbi:hypothetical protein BH11PSE7_BH11PSE7_06440 [soil metagenome]